MSDSVPQEYDNYYNFNYYPGVGAFSVEATLNPDETITAIGVNGVDYTTIDPSLETQVFGQYLLWQMAGPSSNYEILVAPVRAYQDLYDAVQANEESGSSIPVTETFYYTVANDVGSTTDSITAALSDIYFTYQGQPQGYTLPQDIAVGSVVPLGDYQVHEGVASWQDTDANDPITLYLRMYSFGSVSGDFVYDPTKIGAGGGTGESITVDDTPGVKTVTITGSVGQVNAELQALSYSASPDAGTYDILDYAVMGVSQYADTSLATFVSAACYCPGTLIRTPFSDVPIEDLSIGDHVMTLHDGPQKVRWIGRRSYDGRFIADQVLMLPVCLRRGSIAADVPSRDLWVSPGHAIYVEGALVPAWRLVNGRSIIQAVAVKAVTYLHIELDRHGVLFAEDCPAESFLDDQMHRNQFANAAEYWALYSDVVPGMACAPRLEDGFGLQAIQQRLARRAGVVVAELPPGPLRGFIDYQDAEKIAGWAQDCEQGETPVRLEIVVDGCPVLVVLANQYRADLRKAGIGSGQHGFSVALVLSWVGRAITVQRACDGVLLARTEAAVAA